MVERNTHGCRFIPRHTVKCKKCTLLVAQCVQINKHKLLSIDVYTIPTTFSLLLLVRYQCFETSNVNTNYGDFAC